MRRTAAASLCSGVLSAYGEPFCCPSETTSMVMRARREAALTLRASASFGIRGSYHVARRRSCGEPNPNWRANRVVHRSNRPRATTARRPFGAVRDLGRILVLTGRGLRDARHCNSSREYLRRCKSSPRNYTWTTPSLGGRFCFVREQGEWHEVAATAAWLDTSRLQSSLRGSPRGRGRGARGGGVRSSRARGRTPRGLRAAARSSAPSLSAFRAGLSSAR